MSDTSLKQALKQTITIDLLKNIPHMSAEEIFILYYVMGAMRHADKELFAQNTQGGIHSIEVTNSYPESSMWINKNSIYKEPEDLKTTDKDELK